MDVISGVPQVSALGLLLFLIFVNDFLNWVRNSLRMFVDDTKIWRGIQVVRESMSLQENLHQLRKWSDKWLLRFNPEKCKVMHVGHNVRTEYHITKNEKDFGIYTTSNLKPGMQCMKAASKARSVLGL